MTGHESGEPADLSFSDENPEQTVGGQFVGDRQQELTPEGDPYTRYRVGLNEMNEVVIDRRVRGAEPESVELDDAPDEIRRAAHRLLSAHVPDARSGGPSPGWHTD